MRNGLGQDFRKGPNGCPPPKNPCPCPGCRKRLGLGQGHFEFKSPIWMPPPEKLWQILAKKGILIYNNAIKPAIFHKNLSCQTKKRKILLYSIPLYYFFFGGGANIKALLLTFYQTLFYGFLLLIFTPKKGGFVTH